MTSKTKRSGAGWPALANAALGAWFFLSPFFLFHFEEMTSSLNAYIAGSAIMVLAGYAGQSKGTGEDMLVGLTALWVIASPWTLGFNALTTAGTWSAVLTGLAVLACSGWSISLKRVPETPIPLKAG